MLFPPQPVRIALALVVLWAPLCSHAGLQLRYYPNTGSSPNVADWREAVLDSSDIVEARPSTTAPAVFTVMRALHGSLRKAAKLPFSRCAGIEMETSPEETLRDLLRAPIVDHVLPDHTLPVDEVEALAQYSTPSENATYLLAIVRHRDEVGFIWRFPLQTVGGDMLLLQDGLAYIAVPVPGWQEKRHEPRLRHVWVPHPYMPKRSDLERVLDEEINFKDGFLRDLHRADKQLRIEALRRYVDSTDVERKRFVYAHRAVEAIAATGAVGTAYLREQSATPPFANYLWSVVDEQRKQHDRAAVPWLRQNIEHAMRRSPSLSWPQTYCYSDNEASLATLVFLCQGAQTLAALGDDQGVRFIRASIAWQLAQGRDWWSAKVPFTLNDQQQSQPFSATPVPESDPLIVMSRAIMDDPLFRPYPPLDQERTGRLDKTLRQWAKQYRNEAIPGLLWVWAQDYDPNVGQIHRGVRPKLAREALIELIGEDLGTDALAYWRLYLQRIEEENALRAAGG